MHPNLFHSKENVDEVNARMPYLPPSPIPVSPPPCPRTQVANYSLVFFFFSLDKKVVERKCCTLHASGKLVNVFHGEYVLNKF